MDARVICARGRGMRGFLTASGALGYPGHMRHIITLSAIVLALSSCASAHDTSEPQAGIYDLSAHGELDACSPARATGMIGAVGVVSSGDVLSLAAPDPTRGTMLHVSLSRPAGYHDTSSVALRGCTAATLERTFTVLDASDTAIRVAYHEQWTGIETCGDAMRSLMPAAPLTDCEADLVLDYQLTEACGATCEVGLSASGPSCLCD
jgi:hypothetical protein